jgi:hypothetical protein
MTRLGKNPWVAPRFLDDLEQIGAKVANKTPGKGYRLTLRWDNGSLVYYIGGYRRSCVSGWLRPDAFVGWLGASAELSAQHRRVPGTVC